MVFGAVLGIAGVATSLFGSRQRSKASRKAARGEEERAAETADVRRLQGREQRAQLRQDRAATSGIIASRAAASGVELSGSVARVLQANFEEAAKEEVRSRISEREDIQRILKGGQLQASSLRSQAKAATIQGFSSALQGGAAVARMFD